MRSVDWNQFDVIINAAAYTHVDEAENLDGRRAAWRVNVSAVVELAKVAIAHDITLVHLSSDYVFDGEHKEHTPDEGFSPLGVYGQTKAAADAVVGTVPKHYIVRTSWVVGNGDRLHHDDEAACRGRKGSRSSGRSSRADYLR